MIDSTSIVDVQAHTRKRIHPLLNPSSHVTFDGGKRCSSQRNIFPTFSSATSLAALVTVAKRLSDARAKAFMKTGRPVLISKAERMNKCGRYVSVTPTGNVIANRCHRRGCPMCDTHKSRVAGGIVRRIFNRVADPMINGYFLTTSTGPNCDAEELREHVQLINDSFRRFMTYAAIKKHSNIIGASRGTEVTYKGLVTGYNPHTHIILWTYGPLTIKGQTNEAVLSQKLQALWTRAVKRARNEQPVFECKRITVEHSDDKSLGDAYARMTRYITKAFKMSPDGSECDELNLPDHAQVTVSEALRGLRLISHSGWIKDEIKNQKALDKIASKEKELQRLHDPKRLNYEDLTHFIWDQPTGFYVFRDENICRYDRPKLKGDDCETIESPKYLEIPIPLEEQHQLFICKNKEDSDLAESASL